MVLEQKGMQAQSSAIVTTIEGRMYRRCFTSFKKCTKLIDLLKNYVDKAVEAFQHDGNYFLAGFNPHGVEVDYEMPVTISP